MGMLEVEGMNMVKGHDHPTNHWLGEEGMNMVKEHYHLTNHCLKVDDIDMGVSIWWRWVVWIWWSARRTTDRRWGV
jgi:hypothetical protein